MRFGMQETQACLHLGKETRPVPARDPRSSRRLSCSRFTALPKASWQQIGSKPQERLNEGYVVARRQFLQPAGIIRMVRCLSTNSLDFLRNYSAVPSCCESRMVVARKPASV